MCQCRKIGMNDKLSMLPRMMKNAQPIAFYAAVGRARPLLKPFANASLQAKHHRQRFQTYNLPHERDDTTPEYLFHDRTVVQSGWAISYPASITCILTRRARPDCTIYDS